MIYVHLILVNLINFLLQTKVRASNKGTPRNILLEDKKMVFIPSLTLLTPSRKTINRIPTKTLIPFFQSFLIRNNPNKKINTIDNQPQNHKTGLKLSKNLSR